MNRKILISLVAGVALAGTAVAIAAPRGGMRAALGEMDTDGNRAISAAEAQSYFANRATDIDANRDGAITPAEVKAFREAERARRAAERFAEMDANKDGRVSVDEFATARVEQMMSRDADGDGELEPGEGRRHGRRGH